MNDLQIYRLMAKTPKIRAVQIADALDAELVDVSAVLRSLVEVGDVVQSKGFSPNGHPAQLYDLSPDFRRSPAGIKIIAEVAAAPAPAADQVSPSSAPVAAPADAVRTRVDRALSHLKEHTTATDDQLRAAMGLEKPAAPSAYLKSAIDAGKIHKGSTGMWALGRRCGSISVASKSKNGPVAQFAPTAQPEELKPADVANLPPAVVEQLSKPAQVLAAALAEPMAPVFRCGLWSDGVLELQRNGRSLVELTRGEGEQLAEFMNRMLGAAEKVAA